jgi:hypothetical protein
VPPSLLGLRFCGLWLLDALAAGPEPVALIRVGSVLSGHGRQKTAQVPAPGRFRERLGRVRLEGIGTYELGLQRIDQVVANKRRSSHAPKGD